MANAASARGMERVGGVSAELCRPPPQLPHIGFTAARSPFNDQ